MTHTSAATSATYLGSDDVAKRLRLSRRMIHELSRKNAIPHRVLPGSRRLLFQENWLTQWADGAPLELVELMDGGRIVRPVES